MKIPYTTKGLFYRINGELKDKRLYPDLLEWGCACSKDLPILTYEWDLIGIVKHGGNEGIYLDLYCYGDTGNDMMETPVGTYKTLRTDKEAFKAMSDLNTEFVFATRDFVEKNIDDFTWRGYNVYGQTGEVIDPRYEVPEWRFALSRANEIAKDLKHPVDRVLLRENATRIVTAYDVKDGGLVPMGKLNIQIA